jgi:hypothetical protein
MGGIINMDFALDLKEGKSESEERRARRGRW